MLILSQSPKPSLQGSLCGVPCKYQSLKLQVSLVKLNRLAKKSLPENIVPLTKQFRITKKLCQIARIVTGLILPNKAFFLKAQLNHHREIISLMIYRYYWIL